MRFTLIVALFLFVLYFRARCLTMQPIAPLQVYSTPAIACLLLLSVIFVFVLLCFLITIMPCTFVGPSSLTPTPPTGPFGSPVHSVVSSHHISEHLPIHSVVSGLSLIVCFPLIIVLFHCSNDLTFHSFLTGIPSRGTTDSYHGPNERS